MLAKLFCFKLFIIIFILVLGWYYQLEAADKTLSYVYYEHGEPGDVTEKQQIKIKELPDGSRQYYRISEAEKYKEQEEFILGPDYETISFRVENDAEGTSYEGSLVDNKLHLKGKLEGEDINKVIELDDKPFYHSPKFNLAGFILSDKEKVKFWTIRRDKLTKYLMRAEKDAEETLTINAKDIKAIKVYYTATGIGSHFYKRYYYFRKDDGIFIKKVDPSGDAETAVLQETDYIMQ